MKIKTSELTGHTLDWTVTSIAYDNGAIYEDGFVYIKTLNGNRGQRSNPSINWSQGGPIIDKYDIQILPMRNPDYQQARTTAHGSGPWMPGPTKLVAAMRSFVASHLGDEVDVPEELLS